MNIYVLCKNMRYRCINSEAKLTILLCSFCIKKVWLLAIEVFGNLNHVVWLGTNRSWRLTFWLWIWFMKMFWLMTLVCFAPSFFPSDSENIKLGHVLIGSNFFLKVFTDLEGQYSSCSREPTQLEFRNDNTTADTASSSNLPSYLQPTPWCRGHPTGIGIVPTACSLLRGLCNSDFSFQEVIDWWLFCRCNQGWM